MNKSKLQLVDVTLCCIDTRSIAQAIYALRESAAFADFGRILFFAPNGTKIPRDFLASVELIAIQPLRSIRDYNDFVLNELPHYINTSHALIIQWDGFISRPEKWRSDFFDYDYIGAPWYHGGTLGRVGNGGFSLRSRKLMHAVLSISSDADLPEDMTICVKHRAHLEEIHGIHFAPVSVAKEFSCEYGEFKMAFGFHGMHNFAHVMPETTLREWLALAPNDILGQKHTKKLIKELIKVGRTTEALNLLYRRKEITGWNMENLKLATRAIIQKLMP